MGRQYRECICFGIASVMHMEPGCQNHKKFGDHDGLRGCYVYKNVKNCNNERGLTQGDPKDYRGRGPQREEELTMDYPVNHGIFAWSYLPCDTHKNPPRFASDDQFDGTSECNVWVKTNTCPKGEEHRPGRTCRGWCNAAQCCGEGKDVWINFQPAAMSAPVDYTVDSGLVKGTRSNGLVYGWNVEAVTADR